MSERIRDSYEDALYKSTYTILYFQLFYQKRYALIVAYNYLFGIIPLGRTAHIVQMRHIATDVTRSIVCLSACLSVGHRGEQLNRSRCRLGADSRGPKEPCIRLDGVEIGLWEGVYYWGWGLSGPL